MTQVYSEPMLILGDFNCHAPGRLTGFRDLRDFLVEEGFKFFPDPAMGVPTFISHKGAEMGNGSKFSDPLRSADQRKVNRS